MEGRSMAPTAASRRGREISEFSVAPCEIALALAQGVNVMVRETTLDASMEEKANARGYSSTRQTATLAREADVGRLIMTY